MPRRASSRCAFSVHSLVSRLVKISSATSSEALASRRLPRRRWSRPRTSIVRANSNGMAIRPCSASACSQSDRCFKLAHGGEQKTPATSANRQRRRRVEPAAVVFEPFDEHLRIVQFADRDQRFCGIGGERDNRRLAETHRNGASRHRPKPHRGGFIVIHREFDKAKRAEWSECYRRQRPSLKDVI